MIAEFFGFGGKKISQHFHDAKVHMRSEQAIESLEKVLGIAMALSRRPPLTPYATIEAPPGSYISQSQYAQLPDDLRQYFDAEPVILKMRIN